MDWTPTIADRHGHLYQRIVDALSADIAAGRLQRGQQLPTHRALAHALNVDLSTITRAYREARSRGLVQARVGQGTFVAESLAQARGPEPAWAAFDLSMNLPPQPLAADFEGRITRGIAALAREAGLSGLLNYREPGGVAEEREAAAHWLRSRIPHAEPSRLLIFPGTQCILSVLLATMAAPGDAILTEALTYPGMKAAARHTGVELVGVPCDDSGILPDALRLAIRRHKPKALYLVPTLHNPTTVTMPPARREAVAEVVREHGLTLIEDDAYGMLEPEVRPLASLVPELTCHAASTSKWIAPGLRVSFLLAPDRSLIATLADALRAAVQMSPPLMVALVSRWLRDGSAEQIAAAIRAEMRARQKMAAAILGDRPFAAHPQGHHLWLSLPQRWIPAEFVAHVQRQGLAIVGSEAFVVSGRAPNAVRVALGAAPSRQELSIAMGLLAAALDAPARSSRIV